MSCWVVSCRAVGRSGHHPLIQSRPVPEHPAGFVLQECDHEANGRAPGILRCSPLSASEPVLVHRVAGTVTSTPMNSCKHIRRSWSNEAAARLRRRHKRQRVARRASLQSINPARSLGAPAAPRAQRSPRISCCRRVMYAFIASSASFGLRRRIASATPRVISSWERAIECHPPIFCEMKNQRRR